MKSVFVLAIAGLAASVSAQGLSDLPSCALTCLTSGLGTTGCSITDFKCACSNDVFVSGSATCIQSSCPAADQQKALAAAGALCQSAGVTIPTTFPASSAAATSSVAATSSAATTSVAATTSASSTASASASAAPTTSGSTESFPSVIASSTPLSTLVTSTATTTTASSSGNVTQSVSVPVQSTNAGNRLSGMNGPLVFALGLVGYLAL